jgi:prevent-host-death family protein
MTRGAAMDGPHGPQSGLTGPPRQRHETSGLGSTLCATVWGVDAIGVRELRQNASKYLARVEAGEELSVTMRGRLVARLVPVTAADRTRDGLIASGSVRPARRRGGLASIDIESLPPRDLTAVLAELREDR